jgi:flagellar assembly protein FliH
MASQRILRAVPPITAQPTGREPSPGEPADQRSTAGTGRSDVAAHEARRPTVIRGQTTHRGTGRRRSAPSPAGNEEPTMPAAIAPSISGAGGCDAGVAVDIRRAARLAEERGYRAGMERGTAELAAAIRTAGAMAIALEDRAPRETAAVAHAVAEVALAVARRVLDRELAIDPTILVGALERAVGTINGTPEARVLLHPDVVGPVESAWTTIHGTAFLGKRWVFEADPSLALPGCVVRFEHGFVEAGFDAQLEEIGIALDAAIPAIAAPEADAR